MRNFVGMGIFSNSTDAVADSVKGLCDPSLIIFAAPVRFLRYASRWLKHTYPDAQIMGGVGVSAVNAEHGEERISVLAFFDDDTDTAVGVITELDSCPVSSIFSIESNAQRVNAQKGDTICFEFCTGHEERLVTTLNSVFARFGISLIGCTSYDKDKSAISKVAYNGDVFDNACVYAIIRNKRGGIYLYRENIYKPINNSISHVVTRVEGAEKMLFELDGVSAQGVYLNALKNETADDVDMLIARHPFGRLIGRDIFLVSIKALARFGAIETFKRVTQNDALCVMELGDYRKKTKETLRRIRKKHGESSLLLMVNCVHRYNLFEKGGYADEYFSLMPTVCKNSINFVGGGEQYINQHMNQTMICAVFE